jgi:ATP-dependent helicase/nuclease subunit A
VLSFLTTPEDDLALAEILRSPLCGLTENDLFNLASDRKGLYLYEILNAKRGVFPKVYEMLYDLRDQVDYLRPYELLERILTRHNGRRNLIARLGPEIEEILDVFLDQAIAYEKTEVPSITGFISWVSDNSGTIKRQVDSDANKIRIMTIHGAKGLEAPIVILPDTGPTRNIISDELILNKDYPIWKQKSDEMPTAHKELMDNIKNQQILEKMRLLYVSITRAESWLIICGSGTLPQAEKPCWYQLIESGFSKLNSDLNNTDTGKRASFLDWPDEVEREESSRQNIGLELPDWLKTPAPADLKFKNTISPSALELNKFLENSNTYHSTHEQLTRGTALHLLLEHLPNEPKISRNVRARQLLSTLASNTVEELVSKVEEILCNPSLSHIFDKNSFSEINLSAKLETLNGQKVIGKIDRLIVNENHVLAVDFKSNVVVPKNLKEVPKALLAQMGAYQESLRVIFPDKEIQTAILWTENEFLQELDPTSVKEAFNNASMT